MNEPDTTRLYDGFLPGQHAIEGYGQGGFSFGGMSHRGSILALPSGVRAWDVTSLADVDEQSLAPLLNEPRGTIEFVLIGCGETLRPLPAAWRKLLNGAGLRCDAMATGHAVSTYNILLGERRLVAAALIAVT